jgi:hypothetical protein
MVLQGSNQKQVASIRSSFDHKDEDNSFYRNDGEFSVFFSFWFLAWLIFRL